MRIFKEVSYDSGILQPSDSQLPVCEEYSL